MVKFGRSVELYITDEKNSEKERKIMKKKTIVLVIVLAMLGTLFPAISFPTNVVNAAAASNLVSGTTGTFETASVPAAWSAFGGGTLSTSTTVAHSGSYSLKLTGRTQTWYSPAMNIYDTMKANGAGIYYISIWVYVDALTTSPGSGRLIVRGNAADANSFIQNYSGNYYGVLNSAVSTPVNTWTLYTASINVLSTDLTRDTGTFNLMIDVLGLGTSQNIYFDDVSIYKPDTNVERWRMQEISFTSSYSTQLLTGTPSTMESASIPTGWSSVYGGTLSTSTTVAHNGTYSLKLAGRTQSWYAPQYNIYSILKAGGSGKYNLSLWVYVDALTTSPSNGRILIRGTSANQYSFFTTGQSYGTGSGSVSTAVNTWTQYSGSITVTDADLTNATGDMNLMIDSLPGLANQNLYFDDVQVTKDYASSFNDVTMDVTFTGPNSTTIVMPAFWDGGYTWKVRFAPTLTGIWNYTTTCSNTSDTGLHNQTGTIGCIPYSGNLPIYQKGFVKVTSGNRYFTYDDGTPFFYIGDTHWSMPSEPYDTMFKTLVDDRATKGFTVYQSESLGATYTLSDGLTSADLAGFADMDNRFAYIANAGLVHANAQLFFTSELSNNAASYTNAYLEKLARYWVGRYAAYPVMWTTAQECDDDFYAVFTPSTNPWKTVFNYIHQYDPYVHPQTAHEEYATTGSGGVDATNSAFKSLTGYNWFGVQWSPAKNAVPDFNIPKDYWNNGGTRPAINYEGHYENLWTNEFGARMQGWTAYLNGMYGQGYGAQDIWDYNTTYDEQNDSTVYGITITVAMKQVAWTTSKDFNTGTQLGTYMKGFFNTLNWWQLTPRFDDTTYFANNSSYYSVASILNDSYVAYFYNTTTNTGTLKGMDNVAHTVKWYNPRTGEYTTVGTNIYPTNGQYTIPAKPDTNDWVLYVYHT